MYNYMRVRGDRFTPKLDRKQRRDLETTRQEVSTLLDKQGRKKLLRLVDAQTMALEKLHRRLPSGLGDRSGIEYRWQSFL